MPNIPMPKGFELPEGVKEGEEFDAVGSFVMSGGSLMLKSIDGSPIPGYEDDEMEEEGEMEEGGESPEDFLSGIERRMSKKSEMAEE